jgi:hypothetical protein
MTIAEHFTPLLLLPAAHWKALNPSIKKLLTLI